MKKAKVKKKFKRLNKYLTPAELVIIKFGSIRKVASVVDRTHSAIWQWEKRGGRIPTRLHAVLLRAAKKKGIVLTSNELIFGRKA